jgi:hypothetical protein
VRLEGWSGLVGIGEIFLEEGYSGWQVSDSAWIRRRATKRLRVQRKGRREGFLRGRSCKRAG